MSTSSSTTSHGGAAAAMHAAAARAGGARGARGGAAAAPGAGGLQERVDRVLLGPSTGNDSGVKELLLELLACRETDAFIRCCDHDPQNKRLLEDGEVRAAMEQLHSRGKGKIPAGTLELPPKLGRALAPARRFHKMVVGKHRGSKLAQRNAEAVADPQLMGKAKTFMSATGPGSKFVQDCVSKNGRRRAAKAMATALGCTEAAALGVITKLKRAKVT